MSSVGTGFGAFQPVIRRPVSRVPRNPLDKCTIVSVYPEKISEVKPTLFPGRFEIPAAPDDSFSLLVIEPSSWFKEMDEGMPFQEIPVSSFTVAESVITDYINGLVGYTTGVAGPGLFFVVGKHDNKSILAYKDEDTGETFGQMLIKARERQKTWFRELIRLADVMWARTNGNPLSISKDARLAAEKLSVNKTWMQDFKTFEMVNCKACGHLVNPLYPVCSNCKTIVNEARAKELGIKFAV